MKDPRILKVVVTVECPLCKVDDVMFLMPAQAGWSVLTQNCYECGTAIEVKSQPEAREGDPGAVGIDAPRALAAEARKSVDK